MAVKGSLVATPPVPRHPNLRTISRAGTSAHGETSWVLECACGAQLVAKLTQVKSGGAWCPACNPRLSAKSLEQIALILPVLPATYGRIMAKVGIDRDEAERRIKSMRKHGMCFVGDWKRPDAQGLFCPVFHAGSGEDVPCTLQPIPAPKLKQRYERRLKKAIAKAKAGGREDPRYIRHIRLKQVDAVVQRAKAAPQSWLSALM